MMKQSFFLHEHTATYFFRKVKYGIVTMHCITCYNVTSYIDEVIYFLIDRGFFGPQATPNKVTALQCYSVTVLHRNCIKESSVSKV